MGDDRLRKSRREEGRSGMADRTVLLVCRREDHDRDRALLDPAVKAGVIGTALSKEWRGPRPAAERRSGHRGSGECQQRNRPRATRPYASREEMGWATAESAVSLANERPISRSGRQCPSSNEVAITSRLVGRGGFTGHAQIRTTTLVGVLQSLPYGRSAMGAAIIRRSRMTTRARKAADGTASPRTRPKHSGVKSAGVSPSERDQENSQLDRHEESSKAFVKRIGSQ